MSNYKDFSDSELLFQFSSLKDSEAHFKSQKLEVEKELIKRLGLPGGDTLSETHSIEDSKVAIKRSLKWSIDQKIYAIKRNELHDNFRPEKVKYDLDVAKYKLRCETQPEIQRYLSDCVTCKENKASITIK